MAKVTQPLFSQKASGDFAKTIQFVCGHFLRKKPNVKDERTFEQDEQRSKFDQGVEKWNTELTEDQKSDWERFRQVLLFSPQCVKTAYQMSGFNLWMSYFLRFGEDGWNNYPNPPF